MNVVFPDAYYVSPATVLANTSETTCYTCPVGKYAYVLQVRAADTVGAANTIDIKATIGGTQYVLYTDETVATNSDYGRPFVAPLVLDAGDTVKCTAGAGTLHVFVHAAEFKKAS